MFGAPQERTDWNFANLASVVYHTAFGSRGSKDTKDFLLRMSGERDEAEADDFAAMQLFAMQHNARQ